MPLKPPTNVMCTTTTPTSTSTVTNDVEKTSTTKMLSEDVKVINNLIEDLSRLDPKEGSKGRSAVRAFNRHDPSYTMETEFHSSGSIAGSGVRPGSHGANSGNGRSKRRTSLVSNSSQRSRQPPYATASATVPPIIEKQPGITEQVNPFFLFQRQC